MVLKYVRTNRFELRNERIAILNSNVNKNKQTSKVSFYEIEIEQKQEQIRFQLATYMRNYCE